MRKNNFKALLVGFALGIGGISAISGMMEPIQVVYASESNFNIDENGVLTSYLGEGGDVIIPDGVTSIGEYAFYNCTGLKSIIIPSSVSSIGQQAFQGCSNLSNVDILEGVTSIGDWAFYDCSSLTSVSIPKSLAYLDSSIFWKCPSLSELYYAGSRDDWQNIQPYGGDTISKRAYVFYDGNRDINKCWMNSTLYFRGDGKLYLSEEGPKEFTVGKGDTWDAIGNKLILNGFKLNSDRWYGLYLTEDTIIELKKGSNNTIQEGKIYYNNPEMENDIIWDRRSTIYSSGNLTITGAGTLNLNGTCIRGIDCGGNLSIDGGAKINANITTAPSYEETYYIEEIDYTKTLTYNTMHSPILFVRGDFAIVDSILIGETGEATNSIGIYTMGITNVKNSSVKMTTGNDSFISWGMYSGSDFNIEKSTLDLTCKSGGRCIGINARATLSINESDITIATEEGSEYSVPIISYGLKIMGGTIYLSAGRSKITEGFDLNGKSEFKDCIVDVVLGNGEKSSYGIWGSDDVTITGNSRITLDVGKDSPDKVGIFVEDDNEEACFSVQGNASVKTNGSIISAGTISLKDKAFVSAYEKVNATKGITVSDAMLTNSTGYKEKLVNGKTTELNAEILNNPIVFTAEEHKHIEVIDKAVPATNTSTGLTEGSHCSICGKVIKEQEIIPMLKEEKPVVKNPFTDIPDGKWYTDAVLYVQRRGAMTGTTSTTFAPLDNLTRGMTATLLWKLEGSVPYAVNVFPDVKASSWYGSAVAWAKNNGIVGGYSSGDKAGTFGPKDNITRQDFIKILYQYAQFKGYNTKIKAADSYTKVEDGSLISKYAREAMNWGYENELIANNSLFKPKDNITRRETATIIARFLQKYDS